MMIFNEITEEEIEFLSGLERNQSIDLPFLGGSGHGNVYDLNGKALKMFTSNTRRTMDFVNLLALQGTSMFPKLYAFESNKWVLMEAIYGYRLDEAPEIPHYTDQTIWNMVRTAMSKGVALKDLKAENFILELTGNTVVFVDYGHCFLTNKKEKLTEYELSYYYGQIYGSALSKFKQFNWKGSYGN